MKDRAGFFAQSKATSYQQKRESISSFVETGRGNADPRRSIVVRQGGYGMVVQTMDRILLLVLS